MVANTKRRAKGPPTLLIAVGSFAVIHYIWNNPRPAWLSKLPSLPAGFRPLAWLYAALSVPWALFIGTIPRQATAAAALARACRLLAAMHLQPLRATLLLPRIKPCDVAPP